MDIIGFESNIIPAKKNITLSTEVLFYLEWLVPEGKLTREKDIREFLSSILKCGWIDFVFPSMKCATIPGFAREISEIIPHHRKVSAQGYITNQLAKEKLIDEGFEFEKPVGNRGYKVKNYKQYLIKYEDFVFLNEGFIMRIHNEGIERFIHMKLDDK